MNISANLVMGAATLVVTVSTILAATNASAYPDNNERDIYRNNNRTEQDRGRYNNNRTWQNERRYDNYRSRGYPDRIRGSMPNDFRKVVYRNRAYYTRDNFYYTYEPSSRSFINVRLPFFSIQF